MDPRGGSTASRYPPRGPPRDALLVRGPPLSPRAVPRGVLAPPEDPLGVLEVPLGVREPAPGMEAVLDRAVPRGVLGEGAVRDRRGRVGVGVLPPRLNREGTCMSCCFRSRICVQSLGSRASGPVLAKMVLRDPHADTPRGAELLSTQSAFNVTAGQDMWLAPSLRLSD